nr:hypothetical protein Iba_chr02bCG12280 [Ipomoea batatas]
MIQTALNSPRHVRSQSQGTPLTAKLSRQDIPRDEDDERWATITEQTKSTHQTTRSLTKNKTPSPKSTQLGYEYRKLQWRTNMFKDHAKVQSNTLNTSIISKIGQKSNQRNKESRKNKQEHWRSASQSEQREVCRVEQPPERGIIDAAREWVSTRSRRIPVVDRVSHWTARSHSPYFLFFLTLKPLRNFFLPLRTAQPSSENCCFLVLPSNCHNEEQREVYRVEQPPERGVNDTAREWVSTRSGRISVVNRASR